MALVGIDITSVADSSQLPSQMKKGCLERLEDPSSDCAPTQKKDAGKPLPGVAEEPVEPRPSVSSSDEIRAPMMAGHSPAMTENEMAFPKPTKRGSGPPPALLIGAELRRNLSLWPEEVISVISPMGDLGPNEIGRAHV